FYLSFGGNKTEQLTDYLINERNNIFIIGKTRSVDDFDLVSEFQSEVPTTSPDGEAFSGPYTFMMIISSDGSLLFSSYLHTQMNSTNSELDLVYISIMLSSLSLFGLGMFSYTRRLAGPKLEKLVDLLISTEIKNLISPLFRNETDLIYLLFGMSRDIKTEDKIKNGVPAELFNFKYFFHPVRISILKLLSENTSMFSTEIRDELGITWNEFTSHLNSLQNKGMIRFSEEFIDGTKKKTVQMEPIGIRLFDEFRELLIEFLDKTDGIEEFVMEGSKIKDHLADLDRDMYPENEKDD
ncbi:MAG: transcriptional regulator, partial [Candidatus Kariarchaeaceae archaeon]